MTLSLCMIVKDEEEVLDRCLSSCHSLFDEIIIVDTGSTDNTVTIAKQYTNNIYSFNWEDDFSKARNYSFEKATSDYIMWLDADDVIPSAELDKLSKLKQSLTDVNVVMLKYAIAFDDNNRPTFTFYRERILKRSDNPRWSDPVHEVIIPTGKIIYEDITIEHRKIKTNPSERNLKIYQKLINNNPLLKPRQRFYYARELYFNNKIFQAIHQFKIFLKSKDGYKENYIEALLNISKCYQLLGHNTLALKHLYNSFLYDTPRAEILCEIGNIYLNKLDYKKSAYYFNLALNTPINNNCGGFVLNDCYDFLPHLQLSVCYYYLNDYEKAKYHHLQAKSIKPNHPSIIYNNSIFQI